MRSRPSKQKEFFKAISHHRCAGFTLIDMLVSVGIFTATVTIGVGAAMASINANQKAQSIQLVMNNLSFALEHMARNIRTGITYHCDVGFLPLDTPRNCTTGASSFAFEDRALGSGDTVAFKLDSGRIEKSVDGAPFAPITAPEVVIETLRFHVTGALKGDDLQPRVTIVLQGYAKTGNDERTDFDIQTTVSQRVMDL
jgi:type II secretory pathway pseudopilin PulG